MFLSRKVRLRLLTAVTAAFLIYVAADIFQLPGVRADFQADPTVLGILAGTMLALAGIEALSRLPGFTTKDED